MSKRIGKIGEQVFTTTANANYMVVRAVSTASEIRGVELMISYNEKKIVRLRELYQGDDFRDYLEQEIASVRKQTARLERDLVELGQRGEVSWLRVSVHTTRDLARKAARLSKNRSALYGYETQVIELR
jgi:hypothetical protein